MDPLHPLTKSLETGELVHVVPIAIPAVFGVVVLLMDLFLRGKSKVPLALTTALGCGLAAVAALAIWTGTQEQVVLAGSLATSAASAGLALPILLAAAIIGFAVCHNGLDDRTSQGGGGVTTAAAVGPAGWTHSIAHGEMFGLMLFGTTGMLALVVANDLVTLFLGVETLSIAVYALTGLDRRQARSAEGAMKYFVLGAFSAGFLLYGISLLYGATHTMRLDLIGAALLTTDRLPLATTGGALIAVGLLFKMGAVPFHAWVPDAYQGAPSAATGFMSVGVKVAALAAAIRVVAALGSAGALGTAGVWLLWFIAAISIIAGNAGALTQRNPRRLLAYSAIAHTGYLLIGLVALGRAYSPAVGADALIAGKDAVAGLIFYALAYGLANLGAFAVLTHLERRGDDVDSISELAGLARTQPGAALVMTISVLSLAGIPGTAGFLGKLWVFRAGIGAGDIGLVVLALVASAVSLYYYLYVVVVMYMHEPHTGTAASLPADDRRWASRLAVGAAGILTVLLGIYPTKWLLDLMLAGAEAIL